MMEKIFPVGSGTMIISLDNDGQVTLTDSRNSFILKFHESEYDKVRHVLEYALTWQEYSEDDDEYYDPIEIEISVDFATYEAGVNFEKYFSGNWIVVDWIYTTMDNLEEFMNIVAKDTITLDEIKKNMGILNTLSIYKLNCVLNKVKEVQKCS